MNPFLPGTANQNTQVQVASDTMSPTSQLQPTGFRWSMKLRQYQPTGLHWRVPPMWPLAAGPAATAAPGQILLTSNSGVADTGSATFWFGVICAGASLSERPLQDGGDIPGRVFLDVSLTTHLGNHRLVLVLVDREASTKLVQKGRQLTRVDASGSEDLECAAFNAHDKVSFISSALSHHLVPCQHSIDAFSRSPGERQHLCHALKTCFFL